jgi:hypothetical protein
MHYELVENPFPELKQDEEFLQTQNISYSMRTFTAVTDHIPEGEFWHRLSGSAGGSYASEAAARADYDKYLNSPEGQTALARLRGSTWKWKVTPWP